MTWAALILSLLAGGAATAFDPAPIEGDTPADIAAAALGAQTQAYAETYTYPRMLMGPPLSRTVAYLTQPTATVGGLCASEVLSVGVWLEAGRDVTPPLRGRVTGVARDQLYRVVGPVGTGPLRLPSALEATQAQCDRLRPIARMMMGPRRSLSGAIGAFEAGSPDDAWLAASLIEQIGAAAAGRRTPSFGLSCDGAPECASPRQVAASLGAAQIEGVDPAVCSQEPAIDRCLRIDLTRSGHDFWRVTVWSAHDAPVRVRISLITPPVI